MSEVLQQFLPANADTPHPGVLWLELNLSFVHIQSPALVDPCIVIRSQQVSLTL